MALVPAGWFMMGDTFSEGDSDELPLHTVNVSAFYMDKYEVTKVLWDEVYQWATNHNYSFENAGLSKATDHPVHTINWYDMVKWCNARSEMEGRVPAYYKDVGQAAVYRSGRSDLQNDWVRWNAGYRLPTEAEWEKAARGGENGHRFPWADSDTITHNQANYYSTASFTYDISLTRGSHPTFSTGVVPYTNPADYFAPNGYGLYGMAGNVWKRCWDSYGGPYLSDSQTDPRGTATVLGDRVLRGGSWCDSAFFCRTAHRRHLAPEMVENCIGFRTVLPTNQP
jgi:formylglycine-generating enzyme required for sulfatase activity